MRKFYSEYNYFFKKYARARSWYQSVLRPPLVNCPYGNTIQEILEAHNFAADTLAHLPISDVAFERLYSDVTATRKLCHLLHMGDPDKESLDICLLVESSADMRDVIEVCDVYNFMYARYYPYRLLPRQTKGLVISLRGKDYDSKDFLDAMELVEIYAKGSKAGARLSLEYAPCFFR